MLHRKSLTLLGLLLMWSAQTFPVFGQPQPDTITGCLTRGDRAGIYTLREEGTGFSIPVTGSDDLAKYAAGSKVRLTGKMAREQGEDLFRVTKVEELATTCEPTAPFALSTKGMKEAVGRATLGVRGGVGFDPAIIYIGGHAQIGPIVKNLWFRPSYELALARSRKSTPLTWTLCTILPSLPVVEAPTAKISGTSIWAPGWVCT